MKRVRAAEPGVRPPGEWPAWVAGLRPFSAALKGKPAVFEHVDGPAQAFVTALVAGRHTKGRVWVLTAGLREQENLFNDLSVWAPGGLFFPQFEAPAFVEEMLPDPEMVAERLGLLHVLQQEDGAQSVVLVADSLDEDVPPPKALRLNEVRLKKGGTLKMDELIDRLGEAGFDQVQVVAERGQFAVRGGIVDVFSWQSSAPVRIEFWDVEIDSMRTFDVNSQTSVEVLSECVLLLDRGGREQHGKLRDYIRKGDLVIAVELPENADAQVHILSGTREAAAVEDFGTACFEHPLGGFGAGDFILQQAKRTAFVKQLDDWAAEGWKVLMFFNTEGEAERFRELLPEVKGLETHLGQLNHGFTIPAAKLAVLSDAELFGRYQHARARRLFQNERREAGRRKGAELREIEEGDMVVHNDFGIAKYRGLIRQKDTDTEVLVLEFQDQAKLYVDLDQAHLVSRYVGAGKKTPDLSKLGDEKWSKNRKAAEKSILDYAAKLLSVQAERETRTGTAHPADGKWQWEFENSFIFTETPDQLRAIEASKHDMESARPMDRLICGDVGFGKTEVAIRAAFKAVMGGRQVALLAPTTVLAQQHWNTLRERMSDYPVKIELLSRFRTAKEQKETTRGLADGSVDIVVGTHRVISKDVLYKNLGLVIIDEEQRFGVAHKERFKQLFRMVDVLTLSATPIPRTLYMALMGARDMSTIETAPPNRRPVQTHICAHDERIIRDAVAKEIKRGGQVYFLHNRVGDIEKVAERLRDLVPGARIGIGHGQMDEDQLEMAMQSFVNGDVDVFVCTTIIESGIDIPNANTIIIDRADRFGLADLYQLRGRVGRAGHKAYAYLMLPQNLLTTGDARKRINAIKQYSSLGAGLKIAMRDLEIRGAGNLLGTQQSGHIFNLGFDLYCQMLKRAVARVKGTDPGLRVEVAFHCDFLCTSEALYKKDAGKLPAFIPQSYMTGSRLRITAYKEVAELAGLPQLAELRKAWRDRFGPMPEQVENMLVAAELRLTAAVNDISAVEIKDTRLMLTRQGDYIQIAGKFPRLGATRLRDKLIEARGMMAAL